MWRYVPKVNVIGCRNLDARAISYQRCERMLQIVQKSEWVAVSTPRQCGFRPEQQNLRHESPIVPEMGTHVRVESTWRRTVGHTMITLFRRSGFCQLSFILLELSCAYYWEGTKRNLSMWEWDNRNVLVTQAYQSAVKRAEIDTAYPCVGLKQASLEINKIEGLFTIFFCGNLKQ